MPETVLVIDHDLTHMRMVEQTLKEKLHCDVAAICDGQEVIRQLSSGQVPLPALIFINLAQPENTGLPVIRALKAAFAEIPVVAIIGYGDNASQTLQAGAVDFLTKPLEIERLQSVLKHCLTIRRMNHYIQWLERKIAGHTEFADLVGGSDGFKMTVQAATQAASSPMPLWIEGEAGTGKETLARAIHGSSSRAGKPFVVVHCPMLPEHLGEGVLFGNGNAASGKLREAELGTLLLKDIGALHSSLQRRLLAFIEENRGSAPHNVRMICTTSVALEPMLASGSFNPTLYKHLRGQIVRVAPLRQRKEDIALLANHFLCLYAASENKPIRGINDRAMGWLCSQPWPGNLRQLAHTMWRAVLLSDHSMLDIADVQLPERFKSGDGTGGSVLPFVNAEGELRKLKSLEEEAIRFALAHAGGCMTRAARNLGIGRSTLYRKVSGIQRVS